LARPPERSKTGAIEGWKHLGTIVGWHLGAWRAGTLAIALM
jgi:hypothetical protein